MPFWILLISLLCVTPAFADMPALDLALMGSGTRALGVGLAQTGASKDLSVIFFNPAGLGNLQTTQFTATSGTILQEVSYLNGLAAWPGKFGTIGVGYIGAQLPGIPITSRTISGGTTTVSLEGSTAYSASEVVLSYGTALSKIFPQEWAGHWRVGADARLITEQVPGRINLQRSEISYGFQNVVARPFTWGVMWRPTGTTGGVRILIPDDQYELEIFSDVVTSPGLPTLWRSGLEWQPAPELSLRLGLNQRWQSGGVQSGITGGVGIIMSGLLLDYAYHPVGDLQSNVSHFFSLGFELGKMVPKMSPVKTVIPAIMEVPSFLQTYSDVDEELWAESPIRYMGSLRIMEGYDDGSFHPKGVVSLQALQTYLGRALESPFQIDVKVQNPASLTREEAVIGIVQAVGLRPPKTFSRPFPDLDLGDKETGYIALAQEEGFLEYLADEPFEPNQSITRAEIAEIFSKLPIVKVRMREYLKRKSGGETP